MIRLISVVTCLTVSLFCLPSNAQDSSLISFSLEDQFDQKYTDDDFAGQVIILVGSDKEGSRYNDRWSIAIHDSLQARGLRDSVTFLAIANVKGVPRLFRGMVKGRFPREHGQSILLDWKGLFAESYKLHSDVSNILLFDKQGRMVHRMEGQELDQKKLKVFTRQIMSLFE
jgi:hypothetical protein